MRSSATTLFCCLLCAWIYPSQAHALDLLTAYELALSNDPAFRAAVKENEAGQANKIIGRSALLPKANVSYNTFANKSKITGPVVTNGPSINALQSYPSDMVSIQVVQPLFNLAALAQMRQGLAQGDMSEAKLVYNTQDLLVRVLQAYSDVLYAEDVYKYTVAQRDAYSEQLKVNKKALEHGEGTVTDLLETKANLELSEAQIIEAGNGIENAKAKLEAITGQRFASAKEVRKLVENFRVHPLAPSAFELWSDNARANNPEIRASEYNIEIARQEYQKQRAAHFPVVSGVVGWNQQNSQNVSAINQNAVTSQVGVQISMPIFSGGETTGKTSQARANYEKVQADYDQTRDKVLVELRKQYDLVNSSRLKIEALNRAVESATELTKAMRKSVKGGERINLDVLVADKQLAIARRDLAKAKYEYMLALLRLKQQSGSLSVEDLQKVALNFGQDRGKVHSSSEN